jgi:hypothetical protein
LTIRRSIGSSAVLFMFGVAVMTGGCQSSKSAESGAGTGAPAATGASAPGGSTSVAPPGVAEAAQRGMAAAQAQQSKQAAENGTAMKKAMEQHGR